MKTCRERDQVRTAAQRWRVQYRYGSQIQHDISSRLDLLDPETASAGDVSEIVGNTSWADRKRCDECGQQSWDIVEIGEEPDYESRTCYVCADCLRAALRLLEEPTP